MLKTMRDNVKHLHWVLWIVIAAFIGIEFGVFGNLNNVDMAGNAATVGDAAVSMGEFEQAYRNLENRYREMLGDQWSTEMAEQLGVARQALDQAVNSKVIMMEAERLGLRVTDEEVREQILEFPVFREADGSFVGPDVYDRILRQNGFTSDSFEAGVREDLLIQKMSQILQQNVFVSDAEVEEAYRRQVERARIRYIQMPPSRFTEQARASREELADYLASHPDEFRLPEQREAAYLLINRNLLRDQVEVPEAEVRAQYEADVESYRREEQVRARHILLRTGERSPEEARAELEAVRERIAGGEDFAAVAREVSEDPASAQRGGDLGFFSRGQMVPQFEEAAFDAAEGELVGPVETPFGLHLLQVTDRRAAGQQPFEEVRDQIRAELAEERTQGLAEQRADEIASELRSATADGAGESAVPDAMRTMAQDDRALFFYEPGPFSPGDPVAGVGRSPAFSNAAFSLTAGQLSNPIEVPLGYAVIYVARELPPRTPELEEVEARVRQAVESERRAELAVESLRQAEAKLSAGASLDDVAAELDLSVQESEEFGAMSGSIPGLGRVPQVVEQAMSMQEGDVGGPVRVDSGAVLFQVSERTHFDPTEFAAAKEETRQQLLAQRSNLLRASLLQQRKQELGVNYSRQVIEQFNLDGSGGAGQGRS